MDDDATSYVKEKIQIGTFSQIIPASDIHTIPASEVRRRFKNLTKMCPRRIPALTGRALKRKPLERIK